MKDIVFVALSGFSVSKTPYFVPYSVSTLHSLAASLVCLLLDESNRAEMKKQLGFTLDFINVTHQNM